VKIPLQYRSNREKDRFCLITAAEYRSNREKDRFCLITAAEYSLELVQRHVLTINVLDCEFIHGLCLLPPVFWPFGGLPRHTA